MISHHNKQRAKQSALGLLAVAIMLIAIIIYLERSAYCQTAAKLAQGVLTIQRDKMPIRGTCRRKGSKYEFCWSKYVGGKQAQKLALKYAREAIQVTSREKYKWLTPADLLGLAANETDFREHLIAENGRPSAWGWDCGITQNRASVFLGKTTRGRKLCQALSQSSLLSFQYAARELTGYKNRYCKKLHRKHGLHHWKFRRCVFNIYNQGPRYFRLGWLSRYYLRVKCYKTGILLNKRPWRSCRKVRSERWIKRVYRLK